MKNTLIKFRQVTFRFIVLTVLFFVTAGSLNAGDNQFSLSSAVLFGIPPVKEIEQNKNLANNQCMQKYLKAVSADSFLFSADLPSGQKDMLTYRKRNLEEQIVAILGSQARSEAKAFTRAVPLCLEWEAMSENPISEAKFTGEWLQKHPQTVIEPFLHLFMAHRMRAGYECAKAAREKDLWPALAKKYRESLRKAKSFHYPLISCVIQDMEAQPYVYLEGYGRP
jgi:hypothetical protein